MNLINGRWQRIGMSTAQANKNHHRHTCVHRRNPDDNETPLCGAEEGAATLNPDEVTCTHPACRKGAENV